MTPADDDFEQSSWRRCLRDTGLTIRTVWFKYVEISTVAVTLVAAGIWAVARDFPPLAWAIFIPSVTLIISLVLPSVVVVYSFLRAPYQQRNEAIATLQQLTDASASLLAVELSGQVLGSHIWLDVKNLGNKAYDFRAKMIDASNLREDRKGYFIQWNGTNEAWSRIPPGGEGRLNIANTAGEDRAKMTRAINLNKAGDTPRTRDRRLGFAADWDSNVKFEIEISADVEIAGPSTRTFELEINPGGKLTAFTEVQKPRE